MANASHTVVATERFEFVPRLLTAILITFAAGFVLLQISVQFGAPTETFDALTF